MRLNGTLRSAQWLTPDRAQSYLRVYLALQLVLMGFVAWAFRHESLTAGGGRPIGTDFMAFWSAAHMAVTGQPARAYDDAAVAAWEHAHAWISADPLMRFPFLYPPTFLLLLCPLGFLAYVPAIVAFLATGYALIIACLRRIITPVWGWAPLVLSPVMLMNTMINQNGAFTASCFGGAMLFLDRRPALGGMCLGMLVCKPHLAVVTPLALLAARRWRALFACGTTAIAMCAASWLAFGTQTWVEFLHHAGAAKAVLENYPEEWPKMQSVFGAVRVLHGSEALGYGLQAAAAAWSVFMVLRCALHRPSGSALVAGGAVASLLCTPYMFDYDLTCLVVPMAFLGAAALRDGWRPWEKIVLLAAFAWPLAARTLATPHGVPLVPPLLACLLILCLRRGQAYYAGMPDSAAGGWGLGPQTQAADIIATHPL
jgi:alpha-1,2-mannosyltransferase